MMNHLALSGARYWVACATILAAFCGTSFAQDSTQYKLYPVDEAHLQPSFQAFRAELLDAIKHKDVDFVLAHLHPDVQCNFSGCTGMKAFIHYWQLDRNPEKSPLWRELRNALKLGGRFITDSQVPCFTAPYVFTEPLPEELYKSSHTVVNTYAAIKKRVPMHQQPSLNSPILKELQYDLVSVNLKGPPGTNSTPGWLPAQTFDGVRGYVPEKSVRAILDYRTMICQYEPGHWSMDFLLVGRPAYPPQPPRY